MKKKKKRRSRQKKALRDAAEKASQGVALPEWLMDTPALPRPSLCKQGLDRLATGVKAGIEDTPAWRDLVNRFGEAEADRILRLALLKHHGIQANPLN